MDFDQQQRDTSTIIQLVHTYVRELVAIANKWQNMSTLNLAQLYSDSENRVPKYVMLIYQMLLCLMTQ